MRRGVGARWSVAVKARWSVVLEALLGGAVAGLVATLYLLLKPPGVDLTLSDLPRYAGLWAAMAGLAAAVALPIGVLLRWVLGVGLRARVLGWTLVGLLPGWALAAEGSVAVTLLIFALPGALIGGLLHVASSGWRGGGHPAGQLRD